MYPLVSRYPELPPRARRIHFYYQSRKEKHVNYLRVRGEYRVSPVRGCSHSELPPRARRILIWKEPCMFLWGTTSACAENT